MILDLIEGDYLNWLNEPRVSNYLKVRFSVLNSKYGYRVFNRNQNDNN